MCSASGFVLMLIYRIFVKKKEAHVLRIDENIFPQLICFIRFAVALSLKEKHCGFNVNYAEWVII
jgi:hypothetical protein